MMTAKEFSGLKPEMNGFVLTNPETLQYTKSNSDNTCTVYEIRNLGEDAIARYGYEAARIAVGKSIPGEPTEASKAMEAMPADQLQWATDKIYLGDPLDNWDLARDLVKLMKGNTGF